MDFHSQKTIEMIARILRDCRSILFITGAGISVGSGMPTYRGLGGLYDIDVTADGLPIEEILSGAMLRKHPELTWKYLGQIADAANGASFNRAHQVIAEMEQHFPRVWTLTQNVDGFHRMAGSQNVIEIHGDMSILSCLSCTTTERVEDRDDVSMPPRCSLCNALMRPNVVLFGEMLPEEALSRLCREQETGFDAVFSIGTSGGFPYIQEPFVAAHRMGIPTIEINPRETVLSSCADYRVALDAVEAMDEIWARFQGAAQNGG